MGDENEIQAMADKASAEIEALKAACITALKHCEESHWAGADEVAETLREALGIQVED